MHDSVQEFAVRLLNIDQITDQRVLEVGSRDVNGSVRSYVESLKPQTYLGVDIEEGPCVDKIVDCEELTIMVGHNAWDLVICTEVLEHVRDWRRCLNEMSKALTDNGVLLLTTRSPGFPYHEHPCDYWRYPVEVMGTILATLGMEELALESVPEAPGVFACGRKVKPCGDLTAITVPTIAPPQPAELPAGL